MSRSRQEEPMTGPLPGPGIPASSLGQWIPICAPGYTGFDSGSVGTHEGPEGAQEALRHYLSAFPDLHLIVEQQARDGQQLIVAWIASGTHQGRWLNIPPTGHRFSVRGVSWLTFERDQLVQGHHLWDVAGLLRDLGLLPALPGQEADR